MSGYVMADELAWIQPLFYSFTTLSLIFNQLAFSIFAKLHANRSVLHFSASVRSSDTDCLVHLCNTIKCHKTVTNDCEVTSQKQWKVRPTSALRNVTKSLFSTCYLKRDMTPMQRSFITSRLQYWNSRLGSNSESSRFAASQPFESVMAPKYSVALRQNVKTTIFGKRLNSCNGSWGNAGVLTPKQAQLSQNCIHLQLHLFQKAQKALTGEPDLPCAQQRKWPWWQSAWR